nr:hypothetical protein [Enemella evansiae]
MTIRSAPATASSVLAQTRTGGPAARSASRAAVTALRENRRTSSAGSTSASAARWAAACTPDPITASTDTRPAKVCAASAEAAAVRRVVTSVPSMIACGRPVAGSSTVITADTAARPRSALPGLTLPNLDTAGASGASRAA